MVMWYVGFLGHMFSCDTLRFVTMSLSCDMLGSVAVIFVIVMHIFMNIVCTAYTFSQNMTKAGSQYECSLSVCYCIHLRDIVNCEMQPTASNEIDHIEMVK